MNSILSDKNLKKLPRPIRKDSLITPRIMHFGPGAFFRSFVASLINDVNQKDAKKWGIIAVSLNSENTFNKLASQDLCLLLCPCPTQKCELKNFVNYDFIVAKKDGQSVLDALSDEQIEIVSLTITEKGYHYNWDKKELDFSNRDMVMILNIQKTPKQQLAF